MRRSEVLLAFTLLAACSGSSSPDGGPTTTDSGTAAPDAGGAPAMDAGNNTTIDAGSFDAGACENACIASNGAAYDKFTAYELAACGCTDGGPCTSSCTTSECASPSSVSPSSTCGTCLMQQEEKAEASACTETAGGNCLGDTSCSSFISCAEPCLLGSPDAGSPTDAGSKSPDAGPASIDAGPPAPDAGCAENCVNGNMAGYQAFQQAILQSCACATGSPCASDCSSVCTTPSTLSQNATCQQCLSTQENMGENSTCLITAVVGGSCTGACGTFVSCEEACP